MARIITVGDARSGMSRQRRAGCPAVDEPAACALERWAADNGMTPGGGADFAAGWSANLYTRGNTLFYQGNEPYGLFFLCSGRVKLVRAEREGRRQIVRIVSGPDFVGERALIARQPYAATAEVMEDARVCVIDAARFHKLWLERPEFVRAMARHLALKLGASDEGRAEIALHTIRERLAKHIIQYADAALKPGEAIVFAESRQELAELLGTSPEVVSRTLKELSKGKLIALEGQKVRVLAAPRLRLLAGVTPAPRVAVLWAAERVVRDPSSGKIVA